MEDRVPFWKARGCALATVLLCAAALAFFYFYGSVPPRNLISSSFITWDNAHCSIEISQRTVCRGTLSQNTQGLAYLYYRLDPGASATALIKEQGAKKHLKRIPLKRTYPMWNRVELKNLPSGSLDILIHAAGSGQVRVHARVPVYETPHGNLLREGAKLIPFILAATVSAFVIAFIFVTPLKTTTFALACFFLTICLQFRLAAFFQWDEWDMILRMITEGPAAIMSLHNQHFKPFFIGLVYAQIKVLQDNYLLGTLINHAFHAANATFLAILISRLQGSKAITKSAALASLCFLISLLHGEVLTWWFGQCSIMFVTTMLAGCIYAIDYLDGQKRSALIKAAACTAISPLCFGNGFSAFFVLPTILVLARVRPSSAGIGQWLKRSVTLCGLSAVFVAPIAATYVYLIGQATNVPKAKPLTDLIDANFKPFIDYVLIGSQGGTILRGLWLLPGFYPHDVYEQFPTALSSIASPVYYAVGSGFFISALLAAFAVLLGASTRRTLTCWLCGQLILISPFILTGYGRWHEESTYALFMRYSYSSLIGLVIIAMPLFEETVQKRIPVGVVLVFAYLCAQLYHGPQFSYIYDYGEKSLQFSQRLRETISLVKHEDVDLRTILDDEMHPLTPLAPPDPPSLHSSPVTFFELLHFVNEERYPRKTN